MTNLHEIDDTTKNFKHPPNFDHDTKDVKVSIQDETTDFQGLKTKNDSLLANDSGAPRLGKYERT